MTLSGIVISIFFFVYYISIIRFSLTSQEVVAASFRICLLPPPEKIPLFFYCTHELSYFNSFPLKANSTIMPYVLNHLIGFPMRILPPPQLYEENRRFNIRYITSIIRRLSPLEDSTASGTYYHYQIYLDIPQSRLKLADKPARLALLVSSLSTSTFM